MFKLFGFGMQNVDTRSNEVKWANNIADEEAQARRRAKVLARKYMWSRSADEAESAAERISRGSLSGGSAAERRGTDELKIQVCHCSSLCLCPYRITLHNRTPAVRLLPICPHAHNYAAAHLLASYGYMETSFFLFQKAGSDGCYINAIKSQKGRPSRGRGGAAPLAH